MQGRHHCVVLLSVQVACKQQDEQLSCQEGYSEGVCEQDTDSGLNVEAVGSRCDGGVGCLDVVRLHDKKDT